MKKKRVFEDDRVFFSKSASGARTSRLGDDALGRLSQPKGPEPSSSKSAPEPPSTLLHRAAGDGAPIKDKEGLDEAMLH